MDEIIETVTLWRPVGPQELELIEKAAMRAFPPRLPDGAIHFVCMGWQRMRELLQAGTAVYSEFKNLCV